MALRQQISSARRDYNRWVADETMEDYALRFTARRGRIWSIGRIVNTALGGTSFLALEAIGGTVTLQFGFLNAAAAIVAVSVLIALSALPIVVTAARAGVDIDLLTRGAGFGYIGSTITSLIYASFTFIFMAIEASIMSTMLDRCFGVPQWLGYILSAAVVIPFVTHGITFINRFQSWTQLPWLVLNLLPFSLFLVHGLPAQSGGLAGWAHFAGVGGDMKGFRLEAFGAAASVIVALVTQVGEQVDYLRFLPQHTPGRRRGWWLGLIAAGPGWIIPGMLKLFAGSFLAWLVFQAGAPAADAAQPVGMYLFAFGHFFPLRIAFLLTVAFILISQTKINVTNAYAGSIAWSNFFSRITHRHPGRVVWLVFNVAIALLLMELGIYRSIEHVLVFYSALACAWVGALVGDLTIAKPFGLAPAGVEFKRAHLYDINPVGIGAMAVAMAGGVAAILGLLGEVMQAFAPFLSFALAMVTAPLIAAATHGRFYLARKPRRHWLNDDEIACGVCGNAYEPEDTAFCPAYAAPICSLCCSLDARCRDACKPAARYSAQLAQVARQLVPAALRRHVSPTFARFLSFFSVAIAFIGAVLGLIAFQAVTTDALATASLLESFERAFVMLGIIAGIACWILVLAHESRAVAQEESRKQTRRLMAEVRAHRRTDAMLQRSKEAAEAANLAKTRFIVGVSHELRTPLNAVLGYAQLLEIDPALPAHRLEAVRTIRRSGEHMAGLIEGLMDISKIEAGRIEIDRREVRLGEFLAQIVDMFRLQAETKGIGFIFDAPASLPASVYADPVRLRQILINLLGNAIKFTEAGNVRLSVRMPGQVVEFEVEDTGVGIADADLKRIFDPFERIGSPSGAATPGIGLGLTITKLLTEILGGQIDVRSTPGKGSTFRVRLLLTTVSRPVPVPPVRALLRGYDGPRRSIVVVDDNAAHRMLLEDALTPLGFTVLSVPDGLTCLRLAETCRPDLFMIDRSMPEMDGIALATGLRSGPSAAAPIIIVSAHPCDSSAAFDAFLPKPLDMQALLDTVGRLLGLNWIFEDKMVDAVITATPGPIAGADRLRPYLAELRHMGEIGYVRGLMARLDKLGADAPELGAPIGRLRHLVSRMDMPEFVRALDEIARDAA